jgi:hypothetical protein
MASATYSASIDLLGAYKIEQETIIQIASIAQKFLDDDGVKLSMTLEESPKASALRMLRTYSMIS